MFLFTMFRFQNNTHISQAYHENDDTFDDAFKHQTHLIDHQITHSKRNETANYTLTSTVCFFVHEQKKCIFLQK